MTLSKITAGFNKTLKQLDTFISKQDVAIAFAKDDIEHAQIKEISLQSDRTKAFRIKENIEGIIS
tara:strand:- start:5133 stop:5327 length:195 start_codon:yes stop_codon:yes gene_type:complete